ncbi:hypothetical protein [Janthinobacterium sp. 1_2014MBL_MicDiv]|uniref:hypothetical protein n=1 Tax=Janthinobacterium sp. 1_2014MBL_MicDiv TaxID=1644131 RepID=UPI0008F4E5B7|nr:hypothetical protein [Janthinobacterium sp. 1_2014MBL_MicDiv]APA69458.1 hypothetical protein YQ44_18605 [Janthinobacterium sp. 1_2014MBL_MicDiv]
MRIPTKKLLSALIVGSVVVSAGASAVGLGFLADTPMAYLNKNDKPVFVKAVTAVLNEKKDGETTPWSNEGLRNSVRIHADITASDTEKTDAQVCRKVQVALSAKGQEQTLKLKVCKSGAEAWKVAKV